MSVFRHLYLILSFVFIGTKLLAFTHDSLKVAKPAKHYFKTTIYTDYYSTGKRELNDITFQSKKLKSYQVNQFVIGINAPVFTKDFYKNDSYRKLFLCKSFI
jgi:5-formaminoimidazole-4-carboxamide-1-beta-D-ribofuranosyl 5'-monophosphate synthetase